MNYTEILPTLEYSAKHSIVLEAYSSLTYVPITKTPGGPVDKPRSYTCLSHSFMGKK
ncbi:hypothetical protein K439DRAFT_1516590 [Ramaria rubella]|nr:hypothetical protein K439DRAFT_1516590 [Ramaria rubella]